MDALLKPLLQVSRPSERLAEVFAKLPPNAPILFVSTKDDDRWQFVYPAVCYLAWPRRIDRIEARPNETPDVEFWHQSTTMFCGMHPLLDNPDGIAIGPNLELYPATVTR